MIKIHSKESFDNLQIEEDIKAFLLHLLNEYLYEYQTETIVSFGEIQYLESAQDAEDYEVGGLCAYLKDFGFEWVEKNTLPNATNIYIISVVMETDYGLY